MIQIQENYDLTKLNTFGIAAHAKLFTEIANVSDLEELFQTAAFIDNPKLFLGGGSNVLITRDWDGIVIANKLKGIEILKEDNESVFIRAMSGEVWHDLVLFTTEREYWGIENLSYIYGTVGAAPMQNIGAYGAELKNVLDNVEAIEVPSGERRVFNNEECKLGYRDSIFKNEFKNKYFIVAITLKLSKIEKKNITYKILQEYLKENKIEVKSSKDVSEAVTAIRKIKLPDPKVIGNAGSFFKNIFVTQDKLAQLRKVYPDIPSFIEGDQVKIPAAWLIESAGWKGKRIGNIGVHDRQALVLVNYGGGEGKEIKALAQQIIDSVFNKFGLTLVPEVNLI